MNWIDVEQFDLSHDLTTLAQALQRRRVPHRFVERGTRVSLQVPDRELVEPVAQLLKQWREQGFDNEPAAASGQPSRKRELGAVVRTFPVTLLLIGLSVLGFIVTETLREQWLGRLTFFPVQVAEGGYYVGSFSEGLEAGQWWRLITPTFLHFGIFHIVFNSLWTWELGRRIERVLGGWQYGLFFLVTALASNLAQYWWTDEPRVFGGLSGVVYAMVGYIGICQWLRPHPVLAVPKGILIFMLAWLGLCLSGVVDAFMAGGIANGAHLGGLLCGALIGGVLSLGQSTNRS